MRWLLKISPQGHRISEPGLCVGIRFASFPHRILTRRPIPLVAPRLKIGQLVAVRNMAGAAAVRLGRPQGLP